MEFTNTVKATIEKNKLISPSDSVLVALSGGPDSVALLAALVKLSNPMKFSVSAVHLNHKIRPRKSAAEQKFCQKYCNQLGIELILAEEDIPSLAKKEKKGLEETARNFRLGLFEKLADEFQFNKIATGHHSDDQVETVLFRIIRGTGRSGLSGIPIKRDKYIRPLLDISREQIIDYLKKAKLAYCIDSSNLKNEFSRNFIRNKLLPQIRQRLNKSVDQAILNLSETTSAEETFLNKLVDKELKRLIFQSVGGKLIIDAAKLRQADLWLRRRVLRHCIVMLSNDNSYPDKVVIDRLDKNVIDPGKPFSLPDRVSVAPGESRMYLYRRVRRNVSRKFIPGERLDIKWPDYRVESAHVKPAKTIKADRRSLAVWLDFEKLKPPFEIRSLKPGDRFCPLGMKGKKKVGDYLTDKKVPPVLRDEVLVLTDKTGIVWLVGFEIEERAKLDLKTKEVLRIEFHRRQKAGIETV